MAKVPPTARDGRRRGIDRWVVELEEYWAAVEDSGAALSEAASAVAWDAEVPTCPGWTVNDLVRHTGGIHRWVADIVGNALEQRPDKASGPPEDAALEAVVRWFDEGLVQVLGALRSAPTDLECFTFLPAPTPLQMWSRRMAHETTIHRVDAHLVAGAVPALSAGLAVDGLDETLRLNLQRPGRGPRSDVAYRIVFEPTDRDERWAGTVSSEPFTVTTGAGTGDVHVRGTASLVYLFVHNRVADEHPGLSITGDRSLLEHWRGAAAL